MDIHTTRNKFVTCHVLESWPTMENLIVLNIDEITLVDDQNLTQGLMNLTTNCPNVQEFQTKCFDCNDNDLMVMAKGWKQLEKLHLCIYNVNVKISWQGFKDSFGTHSSNLVLLFIESSTQWCRDDEIVWQFHLYQSNDKLERIKLIDTSENFDFGTTRSCYLELPTTKLQKRYGKIRSESRETKGCYPKWESSEFSFFRCFHEVNYCCLFIVYFNCFLLLTRFNIFYI